MCCRIDGTHNVNKPSCMSPLVLKLICFGYVFCQLLLTLNMSHCETVRGKSTPLLSHFQSNSML